MTPEFFLNRTPSQNVDSEDGYIKYKQDVYKWHQTEGVNSIINNYRQLIYQNAYNITYENNIVRNMGIDIDLVESSDIHGSLLYKLLDEYLETRGTKTSFKILFQLMFNEPVEITYPRDYILKISSTQYLRTNQIVISGVYQLTKNCGLRGIRSGTMSGIESIQPYYINGRRYYIVDCNNLEDKFILNEPIEVINLDFDMKYNEQHLPLIDLEIVNGGRYYKVGDTITPNSNVFQNSYFEVAAVSKGGIETVEIVNGGSGYKVGDEIRTVDNSHFNAIVYSVDVDGAITHIKLNNQGYNFKEIPQHKIITEGGVGAELILHSNSIGCVTKVKICDGGLVHQTGNVTYTIKSERGDGLVVKSIATPSYRRSEYKNGRGDTYPKNTLQDSNTMHPHVYNIISSVPASKYKDVVYKYNNPTGYVFVSNYTILNKINNKIEVNCELIRE